MSVNTLLCDTLGPADSTKGQFRPYTLVARAIRNAIRANRFAHVSPQRFASDSASQKFRRDTVRLPSAPWAHESQRQIVTRIAA